MTTHYLYGTILTAQAVAANNRGDNLGNTTTLQKVFVNDDLHTTVSAEAIRFALRYRFQLQGLKVNRSYDGSAGMLAYDDEKRTKWNPKDPSSVFIDDDVMGFMDAAAAKVEQEDDEDDDDEAVEETAGPAKKKAKAKAKGKTTKRNSPLSIGRAVSLRPYRGELSYNAVSGAKEKGKLSLYSAEMHTTEYQYSFGLNLGDVVQKANIGHVIDALFDPPAVAGNHARFAYDFSPSSVVLRITPAHSSRIQNCFVHDEQSHGYSLKKLVDRVKSGDVPASEILVGGDVVATAEGAELRDLHCFVNPGVDAVAREARARVARLDPAFKAIAPSVA
jgi:CRISPR-associated protein Cst2